MICTGTTNFSDFSDRPKPKKVRVHHEKADSDFVKSDFLRESMLTRLRVQTLQLGKRLPFYGSCPDAQM
jgi:hypothetical protein